MSLGVLGGFGPSAVFAYVLPRDGAVRNYVLPRDGAVRINVLPRDGAVRIEVFDVGGERGGIAVEGWRSAGAHATQWHAGVVPSGAYFGRLTFAGSVRTERFVVGR